LLKRILAAELKEMRAAGRFWPAAFMRFRKIGAVKRSLIFKILA